MADFELAVAKTIKNEGGDKYTETKDDNGGATKYGISLKFYKTIPQLNDNPTCEQIKALTLKDAKWIYKTYFWDANRYGEIEDQFIADFVFYMAVLIGAKHANKWLQNILDVNMDGVIG